MEQRTAQSFKSECGRAVTYVENDMPIGFFHDYLMMLKGHMVDRMVNIHKQEQEMTDAKKNEDSSYESEFLPKE